MKNTLTRSAAADLLPVRSGVEVRCGTAPTTAAVHGTALPCAARLRALAAADVVSFLVVAPPPRGAPV